MTMADLIDAYESNRTHDGLTGLTRALIATGPLNHKGETVSGTSNPWQDGDTQFRVKHDFPLIAGYPDAATVPVPPLMP